VPPLSDGPPLPVIFRILPCDSPPPTSFLSAEPLRDPRLVVIEFTQSPTGLIPGIPLSLPLLGLLALLTPFE